MGTIMKILPKTPLNSVEWERNFDETQWIDLK